MPKRVTMWLAATLALTAAAPAADLLDTLLFTVHEVVLQATGRYANPYRGLEAEVILTPPDGGSSRTAPLFWDGDATWRFRFSPDQLGEWRWTVRSRDSGLDGQTGRFRAVASGHPGSIRPMRGFPRHLERQDGSRFWFMGDTAWALYMDNEPEKHDRAAAERYVEARAAQGFNVVHSALLSEAGWHNRGGPAFANLAQEEINPQYWQEVDHRLAYANRLGLVCGLALAWGDKRDEPYAWRKFSSVEARRRYARYIAARYAAYDVYFIVSGEWHAEIATRGSTEDAVRKEFIELGAVLRANDPHQRMIAIHPMNEDGSVREFNEAPWMSFGDYQQNYADLHGRTLQSLRFEKPVVNSEYGYYLRDQNGDGTPDKENSTTLEIIRHATWDIVMAGGYVVTGFGTTYFGGNRDPGPFDPEAEKNRPWEAQMGHLKKLFTGLEWWKLEPHDELLHCGTPRGRDRSHLGRVAPPATAYWCLAEPGRAYLLYVRGLSEPIELELARFGAGMNARQWNPRTGEFSPLEFEPDGGRFRFRPPDRQDWLLVLLPAAAGGATGAGPAHGPLRVHPANPRYFTDGTKCPDGTLGVVYLTGSHTWANLVDRGPSDPPPAFDFHGYLDFLVEHHHNFIRLWGRHVSWYHDYGERELHAAPLAWARTGPGSALDGKPKFDLTKLNQAYFDRLRARVIAARDRGIYVGIMLFGGSYECRGGWRGNPFHAQNNINGINGDPSGDGAGTESHTLEVAAITRLQEAYVREVIDIVNDLDNVLYEISNEGEDSSREWQYHLIRFIHEYEAQKTKRHPVGMTAVGSGDAESNRALAASPADWVSPHTAAWGGVGNFPAADGAKVSLLDSDHWFVVELYNNPVLGSEWVWKAFCRGHNPILMEHLPPRSFVQSDCPLSLDDAGYVASRRAMGQTRRLAGRLNLKAMEPRGDLASSGYCLANPGKEYVVYTPRGGEIAVDLTPVAGVLAVEWLHPVEGTATPGAAIQGGAKRSLRAPFPGDAVLHLTFVPLEVAPE